MKKHLLLLILLLLSPAAFGDSKPVVPPDQPPQVIQDPATKVIYYLESDTDHISAVSLDGKLLWCRKFAAGTSHIMQIFLSPPINGKAADHFDIVIHAPGFGGELGLIDKKTGAFTPGPVQ